MDLIPGLPNELSRECLYRVPFKSYRSMMIVCKAWKREILNPDFHKLRRLAGQTKPVFVLSGTSLSFTRQTHTKPSFEIVMFDPGSELLAGSITRVPPSPALPALPHEFCSFTMTGMVAWETSVMVTLCYTTSEGKFINLVYIFDFLTGQWRRGADIPGVGRTAVGLASDTNSRKVLAAGGYSFDGILASAFLYDVERDEWVCVSDMKKARLDCSVVLHAGRFHVISGRYVSEQQQFKRMTCAESLDPVTMQWGTVDNEFLEASSSDYHRVMENGEGEMYQIAQNVTFRNGDTGEWKHLVELPIDLQRCMICAITFGEKMVVLCRGSAIYVLHIKTHEWFQHGIPCQFRGSLRYGCGLDL